MGSPHLKRGRESLTQTEARVTVTPAGFESRGLSRTLSAPLAAPGYVRVEQTWGSRGLRGGAGSGAESGLGRDARILEGEAAQPRGVRN